MTRPLKLVYGVFVRPLQLCLMSWCMLCGRASNQELEDYECKLQVHQGHMAPSCISKEGAG